MRNDTTTPAIVLWRDRARQSRDDADRWRGKCQRLSEEIAAQRKEKENLVEGVHVSRKRVQILQRRLKDAGMDHRVTRDQIRTEEAAE